MFCSKALYQTQSMQEPHEKRGPPHLWESTCSKAALSLSRALWSKGREERSAFVQPENSGPFTHPAEWLCPVQCPSWRAASGMSLGPGSARMCRRDMENTSDKHSLLMPLHCFQFASHGTALFSCFILPYSHFQRVIVLMCWFLSCSIWSFDKRLQQAVLGELKCWLCNPKWAGYIRQKPLCAMTNIRSSLPNISYAESSLLLYKEN